MEYKLTIDLNLINDLYFGVKRYLGIIQTKYKLAESKKTALKAMARSYKEIIDNAPEANTVSISEFDFPLLLEAMKVSTMFSKEEGEKARMQHVYEELLKLN